MARKKPARPAKKAKKQAKKKTASKAAARKGAKKSAKKPAKKKASKPAKRAAAKKAAPKKAAPKKAAAAAKKPNLDRPRKTVADIHGIPSSLDMPRAASSAKSGRADMKDRLSKSTGTGPALTAGDVDADWEAAETVIAGSSTPHPRTTTKTPNSYGLHGAVTVYPNNRVVFPSRSILTTCPKSRLTTTSR